MTYAAVLSECNFAPSLLHNKTFLASPGFIASFNKWIIKNAEILVFDQISANDPLLAAILSCYTISDNCLVSISIGEDEEDFRDDLIKVFGSEVETLWPMKTEEELNKSTIEYSSISQLKDDLISHIKDLINEHYDSEIPHWWLGIRFDASLIRILGELQPFVHDIARHEFKFEVWSTSRRTQRMLHPPQVVIGRTAEMRGLECQYFITINQEENSEVQAIPEEDNSNSYSSGYNWRQLKPKDIDSVPFTVFKNRQLQHNGEVVFATDFFIEGPPNTWWIEIESRPGVKERVQLSQLKINEE